jgi:large subunit ribosomal protein L17
MNKRIAGAKLGRQKAHRESLMRNQMRSLFSNGFLVTTTPKAKVLKGMAESFLSKIQEESLETQKTMHVMLGNKDLVKKASEFAKGGDNKVSIVKVDFRDGDNAETSKITLLGYSELFGAKKTAKRPEKKKSKKKGDTEFGEEKKEDKVAERGKIEKGALNIKDKILSKERARSRSGI